MVDKETKTSNAQTHNIRAAKTIVDTVKSTLGPMGMDKMMVDGGGNVIVTNDGATILRELDVAHPGGKMIVEVAKAQESLCYDGTTSTVVLAGQLLSNSESLFEKGLHPNVICRGYHEAAQMATQYLTEHKIDTTDEEVYLHVAKTAITGKTLENALNDVAQLCVDAVGKAGDAESVRVLPLPGGSLDESYLFGGVVINKDFTLEYEIPEYPYMMILNTGLEMEKSEENVSVQLDAQSYQQFKKSGKDDILSQAKKIVEVFPKQGGILFVRDSVNDHVCAYLKKHNVGVVRRVPESTLKSLSKLTGATIHQTIDDVEQSIPCTIHKERHNDVWYIFVQGEIDSDEATLILRGATNHTLEEVERGFDDALGVVSLVMSDGKVVYGGGCSYIAMAAHLRNHAASIGGRAQMAIEAFADALEVIPATIAENAGHDPLDTVLAMRHETLNGNVWMGPDVQDGGLTDFRELCVYEPLELVKQAVLGATEVSIAMLRIDDIIGRKQLE